MSIEHLLNIMSENKNLEVKRFDENEVIVKFLVGEEGLKGTYLAIHPKTKSAEFLDIPYEDWEELYGYVDFHFKKCPELKKLYDFMCRENYAMTF